ncbi:AAA-domain-containing protein [Stipitochalara longipes BDJ]|nr:AAA-domain-containing protein [Stipitochalara longipes BDJ]
MPLLRVHANRSPTCMVSIWSEAQQRMHRSDDKNGEYYRAKNVRQIQRKLREWNAYGSSPPLLEPYTEWEFLGTTESSPHLEYLAKKTLSSVVIKQLAEAISGNMDKKTIKKSIMGVARRQEAIDEWHDSLTPDLVDTVPDDKWSTFSPGVQQNIRKIESDPWTYPGELKFLDQLVNHSNGRTAYGILKKGRIGGALLYGPPGTGKTHLARVLARETQAVMISVSAADIENMFVGETEKAVKGLFSLGRMLAPSIIFIDEADALFRARSSQDTGYERSRTNQFLYEMDGLIKSETPPFVLLATNFPRQLDHAVLRRTPSRIHIGLPSAEGRERIFNICLREEQLHTDVKVQVLANMTKGYTGSDIRTLCIQAALACEAAMTSRGPETVRILRADHFEKAFRRCSPTVSRSALAHIREFAKEFDSAALSKLDAAAIEIQAKDLDNKKHIYQPLERDSKQIRVLSIYPIADMSRSRMSAAVDGGSSSSGMLSCTLKTVDLDDKTPLCRRVETDGFAYLQKANPTTGSSVKRQRAFWNETSSVLQEYEGRLEDLLGANISEVSDEIDAKMESNFESPLLGTGKVVSRFNWGDYLALSYVWGDPLQREQILLDGHEFSVTRNLHRALLHLAESQEVALKGLCVWIDALCINQDDLEERSSQVKIMELIYSEAHAVCAYIGSPPSDMKVDAEIDAAISWLKNVRSMKTSDLDEFNDADVGISAPNDEITYCISMLASKIFQESYWERMWVMQEIILAPSILWWYGRWTFGTRELHNMREIFSRSMSSTDALRLQSVFSDLSGEPPLPPRILWRITIMYTRLKILKEWRYDVIRRPLRLIDILTLAQSSRATDLRDKVYGILTLLPKGLSAQIYPNYGLGYGVREAYIEFTKLCLLEKGGLKEGGLNMLSRIHIGPDRELDVPSWVLPLETDPGIPLAPDRTLGHRYQKFHASSSLTYKVTFSEDNMIMSCEGILVDSIDTLAAKKKTLYYPDFEHEYSGCESTSLLLNTIWDSRLALARVLLGDPNYEFANGPSPFDVPWIDLDYLGGFDEFRTGYMINKTVHTDEIKWQVFAYQSAFKDIFHVDLIPNETFKFHGVPLKDYFDSREILLGKTEVYANLGIEILNSLTARRLCTTRNGLLGLAPLFAKPGDRIAILFGCNIPLILRPRGDNYEYIGSCFVEGLMKGEAVIGIEHNREDVREINIC